MNSDCTLILILGISISQIAKIVHNMFDVYHVTFIQPHTE